MTDLVVHPATGGLRGQAGVPSDKSIGHRALILSALATGTSRLRGLSRCEDNESTLTALRALGVDIHDVTPSEVVVRGATLQGLREASGAIDCGNSGTTLRLLAGLLAARPFATILRGDASLSRRPMTRILAPLRARGAVVCGTPHPSRPSESTPPLKIGPLPLPRRLGPLEHASPISSAQVKSCLLLSGLTADGPTVLDEPYLSRDHTERMLQAAGVPLERSATRVRLDPSGWSGRISPLDLEVPGDLSAAAFILVAAVLVPGSSVRVQGVGVNPTRTGILEIAGSMGALVGVERRDDAGAEPVADLHAAFGQLQGTRAGGELVARAIDEVCIACALAARATGTTRLDGAAELRVKESDRLAMMATTLRAFGVECDELPDGLVIEGTSRPLRAAVIECAGDHRIAMTAAVLALVADGPSRVRDVDCIATSFPSFVPVLRSLGARIEVRPDARG